VPLAGGMLGGFATASEVKGWYKTLRKPWWNPP
jgi:tryptophan-rich sensory protein